MQLLELDLHGYELSEALVEIYMLIGEIDDSEQYEIKLIHGYHSGQVLKHYIKSTKFLQEMKKNNIHLTKINRKDPGSSSFLYKKIA
ncbi:MAG: hypothetical protein ACTSVU_02590 [Promethearchaeota archaeon]